MKTRLALLLAIAAPVLSAGCATSTEGRVPADEDMGELECFAVSTGPFGRMGFDAQVSLRTGTTYHSARWEPVRRTRPASIREVHLYWTTPPEADDGATVTLGLTSQHWFEGQARLVLTGQSGPPLELGTFSRRYTPPVSRGARLYEGIVRLPVLRGTIGEADRAQLALVGEDGAVLVLGWIEAASLAQAEEALAAMRPAIDDVLADPARNCEPPRPIIVMGDARVDRARTG